MKRKNKRLIVYLLSSIALFSLTTPVLVNLSSKANITNNAKTTIYNAKRTDLSKAIRIKNLGTILFESRTLGDKEKLSVVMNALFKFKENTDLNTSEIDIINITSKGALVQAKVGSSVYFGQAHIFYNVRIGVRRKLSRTIINKNLGDIVAAEKTFRPTEAKVKEAVQKFNISLIEDGYRVIHITPNSALLEGDGYIYDGPSVLVSFYVVEANAAADLNDVITKTDLGQIIFTEEYNDKQLLDKVNLLNPDLNIKENEVSIEPISGWGFTTQEFIYAKIKTNSSRFKGDVEVQLKIVLQKDLAKMNLNGQLGTIEYGKDDDFKYSLINDFYRKNSGKRLDSSVLYIAEDTIDKDSTTATIKGTNIDDKKTWQLNYINSFEINFQFHLESYSN